MTLTAQPWAVTTAMVDNVRRQGLSEDHVEAAVGVIAMFNYFTRVADATGIEFDYESPLPAFEPDRCQVRPPAPGRPESSGTAAGTAADERRLPAMDGLRAAWESWRSYELQASEPIGQRERRFLAAVAAEEATDWTAAEALGGAAPAQAGDDQLAGFARKLSREPWQMEEDDLNGLRALGYQDEAVLHVISVVAHQNADSRLALGLRAAAGS